MKYIFLNAVIILSLTLLATTCLTKYEVLCGVMQVDVFPQPLMVTGDSLNYTINIVLPATFYKGIDSISFNFSTKNQDKMVDLGSKTFVIAEGVDRKKQTLRFQAKFSERLIMMKDSLTLDFKPIVYGNKEPPGRIRKFGISTIIKK